MFPQRACSGSLDPASSRAVGHSEGSFRTSLQPKNFVHPVSELPLRRPAASSIYMTQQVDLRDHRSCLPHTETICSFLCIYSTKKGLLCPSIPVACREKTKTCTRSATISLLETMLRYLANSFIHGLLFPAHAYPNDPAGAVIAASRCFYWSVLHHSRVRLSKISLSTLTVASA